MGRGENWLKFLKKDEWFILAVMVLVALAAFGLGRFSSTWGQKEKLQIVSSGEVRGAAAPSHASSSEASTSGAYVASRTGTKYHLPWCAGAQSMKPENQIYFDTKEAAEAAGYTPAGNCKGL